MSLSDHHDIQPSSTPAATQDEADGCQRWQPPSISRSGRGLGTLAAELKSKHDEAAAQGYAEGLRQAQAEIQAEKTRQQEAFNRVMDLLCRPLAAIDPEVEHAVARLALEVGSQLHESELSTQPGVVAKIVEAALTIVSEHENTVALHLNPIDFEIVEEALPHLWREARVTPVADPLVEAGGCIVKGAFSSVDATNSTRLTAIREAVISGLPQLEPHPTDAADLTDD